MISIIIPTVGRPHRLPVVVENIRSATTVDHEIVFVVEEDDRASIDALFNAEVPHQGPERFIFNRGPQSYAGAANTAYHQSHQNAGYLFAGSDDLRFHPGWAEAALARMDDQVQVVGTNDLLNPYVQKGWHATHYLIDRRYLDEEGGCVDEGPGSFLHEGYSHNYTDTEFIGTAKARARFRPCLDSIVEHLHYSAGKSPRDATSEKTEAGYGDDSTLYDQRKGLWWNLSR